MLENREVKPSLEINRDSRSCVSFMDKASLYAFSSTGAGVCLQGGSNIGVFQEKRANGWAKMKGEGVALYKHTRKGIPLLIC